MSDVTPFRRKRTVLAVMGFVLGAGGCAMAYFDDAIFSWLGPYLRPLQFSGLYGAAADFHQVFWVSDDPMGSLAYYAMQVADHAGYLEWAGAVVMALALGMMWRMGDSKSRRDVGN